MLKNADTSNGFLIDGCPREVAQAKKFEKLVSSSFFLNIKDDKLSLSIIDCSMYSCFVCECK